MGASGWAYLVPYQPDINWALQELRQEIFQAGDYYKPTEWYKRLHEMNIIDERKLNERLKEFESIPEPKTVQELIELRGEEGTHSIIDIEKASSIRDIRVISPLTPQEFADIFGTDKPTREMVEQKAYELRDLRERWEGVYVVVYKDGLPDEIFFIGFSGD